MMTVGILALQGDFAEHQRACGELGATCRQLRQAAHLEKGLDALILPGGESTVQGRLLRELDMMEPLRGLVREGIPTLATCAGLILLAERIEGQAEGHLQTLPVTVRRNAYGRQLESFRTAAACGSLERLPMTFIRAPCITATGDGVSVLSRIRDKVVAVRYKNQLGLAFHPELDEDSTIHSILLEGGDWSRLG